MSDIEIRAYRPGDEQGILQGYNKVFTAQDGIPPRSMAHWRWKFLDNPTGQIHIAVAEDAQAGIVGCYVTLPYRIWLEQAPAVAGQVVDLYVLPEFRRAGARPGLFVNVGLKHYELFRIPGEGKNVFTYGWPVPNWRIGQKYLSYENIRDWDFLFQELRPDASPRATSASLQVTEVERYGADVDALWDRLKVTMGLAIVRDATYLNWRYADAHDASYRLYECREQATGALRGVAVYRQCDFLFPRSAFLVDWLVPPDDDDATAALVATAERQARQDQAPVLSTLFPQQHPLFLKFQHLGFKVYGTRYFLVVAPFDNRGTLFYREQWYHTPGDSDLV